MEKNLTQKLLDCALDTDRGIVTMKASLDNKKIIDIIVDNTDIQNLKVISNNLPQSPHYKEIRNNDLFNLTITNNTQYDSWEKPHEFKTLPVVYKAVGHCFCGYIDNNELSVGDHVLTYQTHLEGSDGLDKTKGWDFDSDITYNFKVTQ